MPVPISVKIAFPQDAEEMAMAFEVGMQNAAQAIAVATSPFVFNDASIAVPAIIYALMMNVALLAYVGVIRLYNCN